MKNIKLERKKFSIQWVAKIWQTRRKLLTASYGVRVEAKRVLYRDGGCLTASCSVRVEAKRVLYRELGMGVV